MLSLEVIYMKPDTEDIKMAVGYYGQALQTIEFTRGSDGDAYIMVSSNQTPPNVTEICQRYWLKHPGGVSPPSEEGGQSREGPPRRA